MKKTIDTTHKLFQKADAISVASALKGGDPDWDYRVVHCPKGTGFSFIEVFDEDGKFVDRV